VYVMGPAPELTQMVPRDGVILFIAFSDVQSCATAGWLSGERVLGLCGCCLPGIAVHLALESLLGWKWLREDCGRVGLEQRGAQQASDKSSQL
jgi:hypothetical protein